MSPYRFDVVSLLPQAFESLKNLGVIGRAFDKDLARLFIHNPRDFTSDRYRKVDDLPYGGGAGMVLKPEPFFSAYDLIPKRDKRKVILMSPQGRLFTQADLENWSEQFDQLILICGQYEGFDERIRSIADDEISLGDFVLTGGEIPAMSIINGVTRLLPGTLGDSDSLKNESHNDYLLEHPHYTRPFVFKGLQVPDVLKSGDHEAIFNWRENQRKLRTKERRPDLYEKWLAKKDTLEMRMDKSRRKSVEFRIGNGYDMHRLVPNRPLIIGGLSIKHPNELGLDGHSDADVLSHAVMDAMLGALSLGDIGKYFPPDDPKWKGADSLKLLDEVVSLIKGKGWEVVNVDSVIIAERPKMKPHINEMRENLAKRLKVSIDCVGVKATTNERLGAEGREEGISCHSVALLRQI